MADERSSGDSTIPAAVSRLGRPPAPEEDPAPVFVLAAGWRSGSTLLQRMLMPHAFVWGEPYGHAGPIPAMAETIRCLTGGWPEPGFFYRGQPAAELRRNFVANLYPPVADLREAHRAWFRTLFERPAKRAGAERWGLKEVRLGIDHAHYLRWLFPRAKFLFLHRNPYDAFRSYAARRARGITWYRRWPDEPVTTRLFARHWRESATGFAAGHAAVGGIMLSHADLAAGRLDAVEEYLGFPLSRDAAAERPDDGPPPLAEVPPADLPILERELGGAAAEFGYDPPGPSTEPPRQLVTETAGPVIKPAPPERSRCVVLVPVGSHVARPCEESLRELEHRGYPVRRVHGFAAIDQGRNRMATDALRDGFAETLWVDADVAFHPDAVERLRGHGEPVVCGIYPKKGRRELACHVLPGTEKLRFGRGGGLTEIQYAGAGFLLVRRRVYLDVQARLPVPVANEDSGEPMIPFFQPLIRPRGDGHWYLAEDYAFCHRVREAGHRVLADTTIRLWHVGEYRYGWEDAGIDRERYAGFDFRLTDDGDR